MISCAQQHMVSCASPHMHEAQATHKAQVVLWFGLCHQGESTRRFHEEPAQPAGKRGERTSVRMGRVRRVGNREKGVGGEGSHSRERTGVDSRCEYNGRS